MKKFIPLILLLIFTGCCASNNIISSNGNDNFAGVWKTGSSRNAVLEITAGDSNTYILKFINGNSRWEGTGYQQDDKLIAVFRYKNVDEYGFVTFKFVNINRISYVSMNPDGSVRVRGYYTKYYSH